jgi:hypothetical protein
VDAVGGLCGKGDVVIPHALSFEESQAKIMRIAPNYLYFDANVLGIQDIDKSRSLGKPQRCVQQISET